MARNVVQGGGDYDYFYLKLSGQKENEKPHFTVKTKKEDKYVEEESTWDIQGQLRKIEWETYKYNKDGKEMTGIGAKIHLLDPEVKEWYILQMGFGWTMRGIFNNLFSLTENQLKDVYISVWKNPETGQNGASVKIGGAKGEKMSWKFDYKEHLAPFVKKFEKGDGSVINDYSGLDKFFQEEIVKFNKIIEAYWNDSERKLEEGSVKHEPIEKPEKSIKEKVVEAKEEIPPPPDTGDDLPW